MQTVDLKKRGLGKGQKRPYWYRVLMLFYFVFLVYIAPHWFSSVSQYIETNRYAQQCIGHEDCYYLKGSLTQKHLDEIGARQSSLKRLYVNSGGGKIGLAADIAKIIYQHDLSLHIVSNCSSACSNYFIPAARKVYALNNPILASHGSGFEIAWRYEQEGYNYREVCGFRSLKWQDFLFKEKGLSQEFNLTEIKHLGETKFRLIHRQSGCPRFMEYQHAVSYWLPTSAQYRNLLGVEIEGEICADDLRQCTKRIAPKKYYQRRKKLSCVIENTTVPCRYNRRGPLPWVKDTDSAK